MSRSMTIKNDKELEVCDCSRVLDLRKPHTYTRAIFLEVFLMAIDASFGEIRLVCFSF